MSLAALYATEMPIHRAMFCSRRWQFETAACTTWLACGLFGL